MPPAEGDRGPSGCSAVPPETPAAITVIRQDPPHPPEQEIRLTRWTTCGAM
jgi:hypothetical protein